MTKSSKHPKPADEDVDTADAAEEESVEAEKPPVTPAPAAPETPTKGDGAPSVY